MNLPNLNPPKMPPEEYLRRLHLQLDGLKSWPEGEDRALMTVYVEGQIVQWQQLVKTAKSNRS